MEADRRIAFIPEIDFLRAIAVMLVLLFHAYPEWVPGGFIGVDVFFVISGFVISRSYLHRLTASQITLREFYLARFRRLTPALALCLLATSVAATFVLTPDAIVRFGSSLLAQPLYVQNFVFWLEGDYFDAALTKPLLHTWSLAVEEQFYLSFGLLILLLRWKPAWLLPLVAGLSALSLAAGLAISPISPKTSFFMLPTRVWQIGVGILAFLLAERLAKADRPLVKHLVVAAVVTVGVAGLAAGEDAGFPGWHAGLACAAAALALVLLHIQRDQHSVLTWAPALYIGRISYGLYLWHWPIISLASIALGRFLAPGEATLALGVSLIAASLSYRLVEQPVRQRRAWASGRKLVLSCFACSTATATVAGGLLATNGALFRYPTAIQTLFLAAQERSPYRCPKLFRLINPGAEMCHVNEATDDGILVVGDSHADQLDEDLAALGDQHGRAVYLTVRNCDLGEHGARGGCPRSVFDGLVAAASSVGIHDVLAISLWSDDLDAAAFTKDVGRLVEAGMTVWLTGGTPRAASFDPRWRAELAMDGREGEIPSGHQAMQDALGQRHRGLFARLSEKYPGRVRFLDPLPYFCGAGACESSTSGYPNYFDAHHLTRTGARRLVPLFEPVFLDGGGRIAEPGNAASTD
ncbi:MAG: acyltransferase family protein [Aurantimonas endophytica]|uniref:acyltransferase family protein n=1 Tax=Aurantimonas endophytica TaxID=1522175 RepID=UPI0030035886